MENEETLQIIISGRVQGVGYRWFTYQAAGKLNIRGTVKNLPNGDVEVFASGSRDNLQTFTEILMDGPSFGYVTEMKSDRIEPKSEFRDFRIITR